MQEQSRSPLQVIAILVLNVIVAFFTFLYLLPTNLSLATFPIWLATSIITYVIIIATFLIFVPKRNWDFLNATKIFAEILKNLLFSFFLLFVGISFAFAAVAYYAGLNVRENVATIEKDLPNTIVTDIATIKILAQTQRSCQLYKFNVRELERALVIEKERTRLNTENFYTEIIFAKALDDSTKKLTISERNYPIFAYNNSIYLQSLTLAMGQTILPEVGTSLMSCLKLPQKNIKPVFIVLAPADFEKGAQDELNAYIADVRSYISKLENNLGILENELSLVKSEIARGSGSYTRNAQTSLETSISQTRNAITKGRTLLKEALQQKTIVNIQWGRFSPPSTISINFLPELASKPKVMAEVITHEQLHYQSSQSGNALPSFFEEAMTQHLTLKTVHLAVIERGDYSSYAYPTFIVRQMMKKIPETTWISIYNTKDAKKLETELDRAYGQGFYKKYQNHFIMMTFARTAEVITYANEILFAIGEPPLIENELNYYYQW